jgi:hypothetical protein
VQQFQKTYYYGPSIIIFTEDIKMWMIQIHILEIYFILRLKKHHVEILEQDIELCPSCHFPVTIAGKEEANILC